jgi:hypothetical protein
MQTSGKIVEYGLFLTKILYRGGDEIREQNQGQLSIFGDGEESRECGK